MGFVFCLHVFELADATVFCVVFYLLDISSVEALLVECVLDWEGLFCL